MIRYTADQRLGTLRTSRPAQLRRSVSGRQETVPALDYDGWLALSKQLEVKPSFKLETIAKNSTLLIQPLRSGTT